MRKEPSENAAARGKQQRCVRGEVNAVASGSAAAFGVRLQAGEEEEEEDEGQHVKMGNVDKRPSEREVEEHCVTHVPFRSWCEHCVRGKSKAGMHKVVTEKERE